MDTNILLIGVITGAIGTGYCVYGRKQQMIVPIVCGIILCVYPYFIENIGALCIIGGILIILPFMMKY